MAGALAETEAPPSASRDGAADSPVCRNPSLACARGFGRFAHSLIVAVHSSVGVPLIATASEPHMPWPHE